MAASALSPGDDRRDSARRWHADYCAANPRGDVMSGAHDATLWTAMLEEVAAASDGGLGHAHARIQRQADDIGTGFRLPGDADHRQWPVSPLPLMIGGAEWAGIEAAIIQRATLMELLLGDIYGPQQLVAEGDLPAAVINGSPLFLRPMVGLAPPGGHHLHFYAADIGRGPDGGWRVIADHTRTPTGAGYALENRLAVSRVFERLQTRLHILRLAPFFADVRAGIAAACRRADPRIAILTPGRFNQSYAEQAHLARYLGLLLVEGEDLAVHDNCLYVRTIEGLKRVDALWRRVDPRLIDPLAFDSRSRLGVAGLVDAMAAGNVVIANAPGGGVLEAPAFAAFLPRLAVRLMGETLKLPNTATWWCGQDRERAEVVANLDRMVIAPAFPANPIGLPGGARFGAELNDASRGALLTDIDRRGVDYVGQEMVELSTMPVVHDGALVPRPFLLRAFATRDAHGRWQVMPGGFARIGERLAVRAVEMGVGTASTDVAVVARAAVRRTSLVASDVAIRRNPGTLPSRVADNLYWLGRYLERAESVLALVRSVAGGPGDSDVGSGDVATMARVGSLLVSAGAATRRVQAGAASVAELAHAALDDAGEPASVRALLERARVIGEGTRERLASDVWRLLDAPWPESERTFERTAALTMRLSALSGLSAENMGRTAGWRFLDLGRRVERAVTVATLARTFAFADDGTSEDDLAMLLALTGNEIGYRQRYPTGMARGPALDLVVLDTLNPRSMAYQVARIVRHLDALPRLSDDGMAEPQQQRATAIAAAVATLAAPTLGAEALGELIARVLDLSDAVASRFFLRGGEPLRATGLTLA